MKLRVQSIEELDKAAAGVPRNLKLVLDRTSVVAKAAPVSDVGKYLRPDARGGEIRIVLALDDRNREMEFVLPGRYDVSPREALRSKRCRSWRKSSKFKTSGCGSAVLLRPVNILIE